MLESSGPAPAEPRQASLNELLELFAIRWTCTLRDMLPYTVGQVRFDGAEGSELLTDNEVEITLSVDGADQRLDGTGLMKVLASKASLGLPKTQADSHFTHVTVDIGGRAPRIRQLVAWDLRRVLTKGLLEDVPLPEDQKHFQSASTYKDLLPRFISMGVNQGPPGRRDRLRGFKRELEESSEGMKSEQLVGEAAMALGDDAFWRSVQPGLPICFLSVDGQEEKLWGREGRATAPGQLAEKVLTKIRDETVEFHSRRVASDGRLHRQEIPTGTLDAELMGSGGELDSETEGDVLERLKEEARRRLTPKQREAFVNELEYKYTKQLTNSTTGRSPRETQTTRKHLSDAFKRCGVKDFEDLVRWLLAQS